MAFKLQLTDEMIGFLRLESLSDADAGALIRLLIDAADGLPPPASVPQPLTHVLSIFRGQVAAFRASYDKKASENIARQKRFQQRKRAGTNNAHNALDALDGVSNAHNANNTPYHNKPYQNKSSHSSDTSVPSVSDEWTDGTNGVDSYDDIFDTRRDAALLALTICRETNPTLSRHAYIKQHARLGDAVFRDVLARFWAELKAGEEPNNRGAVLMSRLKACPDVDLAEVEEARRACDNAFGVGGNEYGE